MESKLGKTDNGLDVVAREQESGTKGTQGWSLSFGLSTLRDGDVTNLGTLGEKKQVCRRKSIRKSIAVLFCPPASRYTANNTAFAFG